MRGYGEAGVNPFNSPTEVYMTNYPWGKYLGHGDVTEGVDACVSSWSRIAPNTIGGNQFQGSGAKLVKVVIDINAVDFGRVDEPLHVVAKPENGWFALWRVATDAFKNGRAVVDHVGHHVNLGILPRNELPVVPDFFRRLNRHEGAPSD